MEENKEMLELLKKIEASNRKQLMYTRIQCIAAVLAVVCFAGIFFLVWDLVPQVKAIITEVPKLEAQMETVLSNLEIVTSDLAAVDFEGMVQGVNTLVQTGQTGLEQTVEQLSAINFETLNQAIQDLADVIEPLAKFAKLFG